MTCKPIRLYGDDDDDFACMLRLFCSHESSCKYLHICLFTIKVTCSYSCVRYLDPTVKFLSRSAQCDTLLVNSFTKWQLLYVLDTVTKTCTLSLLRRLSFSKKTITWTKQIRWNCPLCMSAVNTVNRKGRFTLMLKSLLLFKRKLYQKVETYF